MQNQGSSEHGILHSSVHERIPRRNGTDTIPLSLTQQSLWSFSQLEANNSFQNLSTAILLTGPLNTTILKQSLNEILRRHESLRTTFSALNGQPVLLITPTLILALPLIDLQQFPAVEQHSHVLQLAAKEVQHCFDLAHGPMMRATLLKLEEQEHMLLLTMHHLVADSKSLELLRRELAVLYAAFSSGKPSPLPELPIQYSDFAYWQKQYLQGEVLESQLSYWRQQLADALPTLQLPTDRPCPTAESFESATQSLVLSKALSDALKVLNQQEGVTLFVVLLAAFKTLLYHYARQEDICVGLPIVGRNWIETERLIGQFSNTLVLYTNLAGNPTFRELLKRVSRVALGAYANSDLPFKYLMKELQLTPLGSHTPLFQVMFHFKDGSEQSAKLQDLKMTSFELSGIAKSDLTLEVVEEAEGLSCLFQYKTDLFDSSTIKQMLAHFQTLLASIVADPEQTILTLPLLTEAERHKILLEWNDTTVDYQKEQCVHKLFEAQVEQTPSAIAVVFEDQQLTYQELNARANQLAYFLKKQGVGPEVLVGICLERSLEVVLGLLGILKAGGAYVFLDPRYPKERLTFILEDTNVSVLLTQHALVASLPEHKASVVCLDTGWNMNSHSMAIPNTQQSEENPQIDVIAENLAYVMYTSGSTGKPKGVSITHASVLHYVHGINNQLKIAAEDIYLHTASFSFSSSVRQLFVPLSQGAKVVIASYEQTRNPLKIFEVIQKRNVTVCDTVPSFWRYGIQALEGLEDGEKKALLESKLRLISLSGELLTWEIPKAILLHFDHKPRLINIYGQTETIGNCNYPIPTEFDNEVGPVPTGRPNANNQVYILNSQLQPVPIGIPGEIYVGGNGLARGYFNHPELTAEKFISHPFSDDPTARIYKTGDVGRYLPDGTIELLGRSDDQVKLRGMRVELGEIEAVLGQHTGVRQTIVLAREDGRGDNYLVAYVISNTAQKPTSAELRSFLREKLPEYMVPSTFVFLDALPLTPNGKVDRRALPSPDQASQSAESTFLAAGDTVEIQLTNIWEKVLGKKPIGVKDNFFELGGHSLLAVRLFTEIEKTFGKNLPVTALLEAATVEQLASLLRQEAGADWSSLVTLQPNGKKPPLFCLHAAGGNVLIYRHLARYLGQERPVYALQAKGLDGKENPYSSAEEMAADFIREMRTVQPSGPYFLAGLSYGGKVALEMAQQLHAQAEKVALVAMFDSYGPSYPKLMPVVPRLASLLRYKVGYFLGELKRFGWKEFILEKTKRIKRSAIKKNLDKPRSEATASEVTFKQLGSKPMPESMTSVPRHFSLNLNGVERWMHEKSISILESTPWAFLSSRVQPLGITEALPEVLHKIQEANIRASKSYVYKVYSSRVALFRASEQPAGHYYDPLLGWDGLLAGGLELHEIPGHHSTLIREQVLADKLRVCMDQAQADDGV